MTNAEAWFNIALRPRKPPEGSLGRTPQDGHLDSHTAPELSGEGEVIPVVIRGKREVEIIPVTTLSPPERVTLTLNGSGVSRFNVSFIVGEQSHNHIVFTQVQCCFASTETIRTIYIYIILYIVLGTGNPGQPPRLPHSSWTLTARPSLVQC